MCPQVMLPVVSSETFRDVIINPYLIKIPAKTNQISTQCTNFVIQFLHYCDCKESLRAHSGSAHGQLLTCSFVVTVSSPPLPLS